MAAVTECIDVEAPRASAEMEWEHFIEWVLVGQGRRICTQLACLEPKKARQVRFIELDGGRTRVVFEIDEEDLGGDAAGMAADDREAVAGRLHHDLRVFKQYLEVGPPSGSHSVRRSLSSALADADSDHRGMSRPARPVHRS